MHNSSQALLVICFPGFAPSKTLTFALLPCRAHFVDAVCDFRSLTVFHPDILRRALAEVFMCNTLVFAALTSSVMIDLRRHMGVQDLAALPCVASCANLQIADYSRDFFDANRAVEWLLGTRSATRNVKSLSIGEIGRYYWDSFLSAFVVGIEQQFTQATTPTSFSMDLLFFVGLGRQSDVGTTRELENTDTNERLLVVVDTAVRKSNGELSYKTKLTIQRNPIA